MSTLNNIPDVTTKANDEPTLSYLQPRFCGHTRAEGNLFAFDVKLAQHLPD
jgi:hypothetical protein